MSVEKDIKEQIKSLPSRQLSESRRRQVIEEARRRNSRSGRKRGYRFLKRAGSATAAVMILLVAVVGGTFYYHKEKRIQQINALFTQAEGGTGSTTSVSPMDTPQFRKVLKKFLGTHSFSSASSSITVSANTAKTSTGGSSSGSTSATGSSSGASSKITHLVIRWSQIKDQYGYVFCTYLKNNGKHWADVVAEKDSNNNWRIVMKSLSPKLTTQQLEQYKYFLSPGFRGSLPKYQPKYQTEFLLFNGLVLDPAITQVVITLHNGSRITIPVQNRAYGYVQVQSQSGPQSGTDAAPPQYGYKTLQGYNAQGKLVYSFG